MRISSLLVGTLGAALIATSAIAADLPPAPTVVAAQPPPPVAAPAFDWSGPYAGLFVLGGARSFPYDFNPTLGGVQGGALIGDLWQLRERLLLSVEADVGFGPIGYAPRNSCTDPNQDCTANEFPNFLGPSGHLRAIVGTARDRSMVFVAGGLAVTQGVIGTFSTATGGGEAAYDEDIFKSWFPGLSIGFGAERRIGDSNRIRFEAIYDKYFGGFAYSASSSVVITCCAASAGSSGFFTPGSVYAIRLSWIHAF